MLDLNIGSASYPALLEQKNGTESAFRDNKGEADSSPHSSLRDRLKDSERRPTAFPELTVTGWNDEHDACAILALVRKTGEATHGNLKRTIDALSKMGHRSGEVNGEGDGCGVLTDIPRRLWAEALQENGKPTWLAEDERFFVGHFLIPEAYRQAAWEIEEEVLKLLAECGADLLIERPGLTRRHALGRLALDQEPIFWQVAALMSGGPLNEVESRIFDLALRIEKEAPIHIASLSNHTVVYKVRGSIETLYQYYPEMRNPHYTTAITLGHTRYSTNTATSFERAQPFSVLGHNGEINTIARLREQAQMLGVQLPEGGSDSQDLDRYLATLIVKFGFSLTEALELVFPPILSEVKKIAPDLQSIYYHYRRALGPYAQGPAGIVARHGDECLCSVDALGLRPLWFGETEKEYFFSSEKGVFDLDLLCGDPKPLSPGEKMAAILHRDEGVQILDYCAIQQRVLRLAAKRYGSLPHIEVAGAHYVSAGQAVLSPAAPSTNDKRRSKKNSENRQPIALKKALAVFGWSQEDEEWVEAVAKHGSEPIGSLGYDGPLAALSSSRNNLADYFKEAVAVVTNPAIDRERETEHFSTQCLIGFRPGLENAGVQSSGYLVKDCPLIIDYYTKEEQVPEERLQQLASGSGAETLPGFLGSFGSDVVFRLDTVTHAGESSAEAVIRLAKEAVEASQSGAAVILLDDRESFTAGNGWLDPLLAVAVVDRALRENFAAPKTEGSTPAPSVSTANLRRRTGVVLRSAAIRHLHDLIMALGLGADAVAPYALLQVALETAGDSAAERENRLLSTIKCLRIGLEKVISTMGIHELRGYGRLFAAIGLSTPVAKALGTLSFAGSQARGLTFKDLDADIIGRQKEYNGEVEAKIARIPRFNPKVWKAAALVGRGEAGWSTLEEKAGFLERETPVSLRHIMQFHFRSTQAIQDTSSSENIDAGITGHALPFVISSMSFGSQSETVFRAYAEAASRLNIIALNGEGGEIRDMLGKYPFNRGQQIASGRFGVDIELINSSNLLEIKIGQGAKPGEGGHLPGRKVSAKVAAARHAAPGVDLISPSNHHDIYSIEDLAQFIEELKTANPKARVAVKVPIVPGIGIIAIGIAKAGADIINLSGFDGGTGAARKHAIKFVGLPAEIGVIEAHRCLMQSGLRHKVELWCDGGMKTASDVVKMICLGANRVGFGTLAMIAVGCTICRSCQTDTCHVGIASQIESLEEAEKHGLKHFAPRDFEQSVNHLVTLFNAIGQGVKEITARLGYQRTQDLVGRSDLLFQTTHQPRLDMTEMLEPAEEQAPTSHTGQRPLRRPRNHLTTVISNLMMDAVLTGEQVVSFEDDKVTPVDRALGTHLAGSLTRFQNKWVWDPGHGGVGGGFDSWRLPADGHNRPERRLKEANMRFYASSVPGNGLAAYNTKPLTILVEGGAQDGLAKGMQGGRVVVLKGVNHNGERVDGSVGKSLAYGATGGFIIVQGDADSRACIRLSGAKVIIGGEIHQPLNDSLGNIGARANVKGFLCEYMTAGYALVLGDPGPWMCAGMTGGVLYLHYQPQLNFDQAAIKRRISRAANVALSPVDEQDEPILRELLMIYGDELLRSHQSMQADHIINLLQDWRTTFLKITPAKQQLNPEINME
jgi:glutamate synthase (NADPH) large chain